MNGKVFFGSFAQLNDYQSVTEATVFKVSMRSKIKKVAVSPKEVKFFVSSTYVLGRRNQIY